MEILSVGIDVGTTTTQLIISRLTVENEASAFTVPRIAIVKKEIIYRSGLWLTPFLNETDIDAAGLFDIIKNEFSSAGFSPNEISTGAVIITGEASRKRNAEAVLEQLSELSGQFVVSTAGPDLESIIAGKGSGACKYSKKEGCVCVNADIGGGTTNIGAFKNVQPICWCCLDIGGRLIRYENGRVSYISPSAERTAKAAGVEINIGDSADEGKLYSIAKLMARLIFDRICGSSSELLEAVRTKQSGIYTAPDDIKAVFLSGGVADCVFSEKSEDFGDIGALLGKAIRETEQFRSGLVMQSEETVRATVVGAGVHLVAVSGSTISYSKELLPIRSIPVLRLEGELYDALCSGGSVEEVRERIEWFSQSSDSEHIAIAFEGWERPSFNQILTLAESIARIYSGGGLLKAVPVILIDNDNAKALGQALKNRLSSERMMICIDSIIAADGDYIDLGNPIMHGSVIPVVVKTLITG